MSDSNISKIYDIKIDAFNMTPSSSQKDFYEENNSGNFKIVSSPCNFFREIRDRQAGSIW